MSYLNFLERGTHYLTYVVLLLLAFHAPLVARYLPPNANKDEISAHFCAQHPEQFKVRPLAADEAAKLVAPGIGFPTIGKFGEGVVVSGSCTRTIKTFRNGVILNNDARFGILDFTFVRTSPAVPGSGPATSLFVPPANIRKIDAIRFVEGTALSFVESFPFGPETEMILWSDGKKSALGTVHCVGPQQTPCTLDRLVLTSPYRIHEFDLIPCLHISTCGSLSFWLTVRPGEEAVARFRLDYGQARSK